MDIKEITYDPSSDEILGAIGNEVHIKAYHFDNPVILVISKKLFHKTWDNWLLGKKEYCERCNEYCGVGGYTTIEEGKILNRKINLYDYIDDKMVEIFPPVIKVTKFYDQHDFEHG